MRISKLLGPVFFALALAAAAGCATESADEEMDGTENAITGSIQNARIARIKQAYVAAKLADFTEIQPLIDDATIAAWNVGMQDPHWFSLQVDGHPVYALDFVGDTNAVLSGAAPVAGGPAESFVILFDATGAGNATAYAAVLLYRADTNVWAGLTRTLKDAKPRNTADGGVAVDAGTHSDGGTHAEGGTHSDGGVDGGGSHSDGGSPSSDGGTTHADGGVDGGGSHSSDGGSVHLDAGPG